MKFCLMGVDKLRKKFNNNKKSFAGGNFNSTL